MIFAAIVLAIFLSVLGCWVFYVFDIYEDLLGLAFIVVYFGLVTLDCWLVVK